MRTTCTILTNISRLIDNMSEFVQTLFNFFFFPFAQRFSHELIPPKKATPNFRILEGFAHELVVKISVVEFKGSPNLFYSSGEKFSH